MIKDHGQSIRSKLLNISKAEKQEYMKVLGRYFHEHLLYRISISRYKSNLMLKGSSLLYAHYHIPKILTRRFSKRQSAIPSQTEIRLIARTSIYLTRLLLTMRNETRIGGHFS